MNNIGLQGAKKFLLLQLGLTIVIGLLCWALGTRASALSALVGGMVVVIPNSVFVMFVFRYQGARAARKIVRGFYMGEALKLILTAVLFALAFNLPDISPMALIITFIVVQITTWFAPLFFVNNNKRLKSD